MNEVFSWIETHPVTFTAVLWPVFTGTMTSLFKPRTPEQYAAMAPRLASFLKFLGAFGLDVPNTLEAIRQFIQNHTVPAGVVKDRQAAAYAGIASPVIIPVPTDVPVEIPVTVEPLRDSDVTPDDVPTNPKGLAS